MSTTLSTPGYTTRLVKQSSGTAGTASQQITSLVNLCSVVTIGAPGPQGPAGPKGDAGEIENANLFFQVVNKFSELDTPQKKVDARVNLELQYIDCGEFH